MLKAKLQCKKVDSLFILFALIASLFIQQLFLAVTVTAATPLVTDYDDNWAKDIINHYIERKVISPDENGNIEPRKAITRAEVATLINKALRFTKTAEIDYTDVTPADSFYKDLQIAKGMGYMRGGGERQPFRPNAPITRQEMSILIARVLELQPNIDAAKIFKDFDKIPTDEAKGAIGAMADPSVKVLEGVGDGFFDPNSDINRAQAYTMMYRAEKIYLELQSGKRQYSSVTIFQKEIFGNSSITANYQNIGIHSQEASIKNIKIWGDLTIHGSAANGDIILDDVIVKGNTYVYGGGSLKINNCELNVVEINKTSGSIRLNFNEKSSVSEIVICSEAVINATSMAIPKIIIKETSKNPTVSITALVVEDIEIQSKSVVNLMNGIVRNLLIDYDAVDTVVCVNEPASVLNATVNALSAIHGNGSVFAVKSNTLGAIILTKDTKITDALGNVTTSGESETESNSPQNLSSGNSINNSNINSNTNNNSANTNNSNTNNNNTNNNDTNTNNSNTNNNNTNTNNSTNNNNSNNTNTNNTNTNTINTNNNNAANTNDNTNGTQAVEETKKNPDGWISIVNKNTIIFYTDNYGDDIGFSIFNNTADPNILISGTTVSAYNTSANNTGMGGYVITLPDSVDVSETYTLKINFMNEKYQMIIPFKISDWIE